MPTLGIAREFLREFGKLQRSVQDRVYEVFAKFEEATFAGLHLETIRNARDPRLRTIRIDLYWHGVVLAPESGDSYTLLRVLSHDEDYRWAQRQTASVNRATGAIELRDAVAIEDTLPDLAEQAASTSDRLLGAVSDADLRRLGVDDQVLAFARTPTTTDHSRPRSTADSAYVQESLSDRVPGGEPLGPADRGDRRHPRPYIGTLGRLPVRPRHTAHATAVARDHSPATMERLRPTTVEFGEAGDEF